MAKARAKGRLNGNSRNCLWPYGNGSTAGTTTTTTPAWPCSAGRSTIHDHTSDNAELRLDFSDYDRNPRRQALTIDVGKRGKHAYQSPLGLDNARTADRCGFNPAFTGSVQPLWFGDDPAVDLVHRPPIIEHIFDTHTNRSVGKDRLRTW